MRRRSNKGSALSPSPRFQCKCSNKPSLLTTAKEINYFCVLFGEIFSFASPNSWSCPLYCFDNFVRKPITGEFYRILPSFENCKVTRINLFSIHKCQIGKGFLPDFIFVKY